MHLGVPQLARLVERACDYLVPPGVVERDRIHDVSVPVERQKLVPRRGVPYLPTREVTKKRGRGIVFIPPATSPLARTVYMMDARIGSKSASRLRCFDACTDRNMTIVTVPCMRSTISAGCPLCTNFSAGNPTPFSLGGRLYLQKPSWCVG